MRRCFWRAVLDVGDDPDYFTCWRRSTAERNRPALNHVEPGVTRRHYNLHAYRGEKRAALETWARYLDAIPANKQPATGTVVPFRR